MSQNNPVVESAGEGYRLVQVGEQLLPTDEVCHIGDGWCRFKPGISLKDAIVRPDSGRFGGRFGWPYGYYRRKMEEPVKLPACLVSPAAEDRIAMLEAQLQITDLRVAQLRRELDEVLTTLRRPQMER